jgi:hypothetical protein
MGWTPGHRVRDHHRFPLEEINKTDTRENRRTAVAQETLDNAVHRNEAEYYAEETHNNAVRRNEARHKAQENLNYQRNNLENIKKNLVNFNLACSRTLRRT